MKPKAIKFRVQGRGVFPLDMLRYDSCFPNDTESVNNISICHHDRDDYREIRSVTLVRKGDIGPTHDRWASFGWYVTETFRL